MSVLLSPKELHEQLNKVVVLDARGFDAYEAAHTKIVYLLFICLLSSF